MPSGSVHTRIGVGVGLLTLPLVLFDVSYTFSLGIAMGTIWLTPDLDMWQVAKSRWGFLAVFWWPYTKIPHRGWLSHSGPVSGSLRLLYLLIPVFLLCSVLNAPLDVFLTPAALWWAGGVLVADTIHTVTDILVSFWRKYV